MTKHYIEYLYSGLFLGDAYSEEVADRNYGNVTVPQRVVGFRFYDREEVEVEGEILAGKAKNYSGWFYRGTQYTLEQVKQSMPNEKILISNMEINNWDRIVQLECGQCYHLNPEDIVLNY